MPAAPEVQLSYSPAGRETLAAIEEELRASEPLPIVFDEGPQLTVVAGLIGRETLALIGDLARPMRAEQSTLHYGDRISNAPGATTPIASPSPAFTIFETLCFVIEDIDPAQLSSETLRREFVAAHLVERLPDRDLTRMVRSEVAALGSANRLELTLWCKV